MVNNCVTYDITIYICCEEIMVILNAQKMASVGAEMHQSGN